VTPFPFYPTNTLGEKPTKLYHHVEALERVGLIRLKEARPNRGTLEKYFQAVAAQFQVAASVLSPGAGDGESLSAQETMLTSILDTARKELLESLRAGASPGGGREQAPLVARILLKGSSRKVESARRRLLRMIEKLRADAADTQDTVDSGPEAGSAYTFTIVFCRTGPA